MKTVTTLVSAALLVLASSAYAHGTRSEATQVKTNTQSTTESAKQGFSDTAITAKVKEKFIAEKLFGDKPIDAMTIHVNTKEGVVYLTGKTDNQDRLNTAMDIAKKVEGVKDVIQKVTIEAPTN